MRGLAIAGLVTAAAAAAVPLALYSQNRSVPSRPAAHVEHSTVAAKAPTEASPPLAGRIEISDAQLREAEAAGLVDRPIKTILDVPERMTYGEFVWNDRGVPPGPVWIRVDLGSQLLSVFRSGHEIGTAVILYGADGLPTPTGKFPILAKWRDHKSATYGDAPMPYTLRLTNDGVSIHGSNVRWGFATHGCVGVPKDFAARMFDVVSKGDEVLIVSGRATRGTA
jgi:lipoprotein-anchoring transpeptidase ErfK/SrfK